MTYEEVKGDLFKAPTNYYLVHCISADFAMGAGIAKEFTRHGVRDWLCRKYPGFHSREWNKGYALFAPFETHKGVINLVTKARFFEKPTYDSLREALIDSKQIITDGDCIAMPLIGCGLDKLEWDKVRNIIFETFKNDNITIKVYRL